MRVLFYAQRDLFQTVGASHGRIPRKRCPVEEKKSIPGTAKVVDKERVQVEFLIDDLVRQLKIERGVDALNCNGCNSCGGSIEKER